MQKEKRLNQDQRTREPKPKEERSQLKIQVFKPEANIVSQLIP